MTRTRPAILTLVFACAAAGSQSTASQERWPTISTEGKSTIWIRPDTVEFTIAFEVEEDSILAGARRALEFDDKLRDGLSEMSLDSVRAEPSGLIIPDPEGRRVRRRARVSLPLPGPSSPPEDIIAYATLTSAIQSLAKKLGFVIDARKLLVDDEDVVEQEAIRRATENAFVKADAIASLMKGEISGVQHVSEIDVHWEDQSGPGADPLAIRCLAQVSVLYEFRPAD